MNVEAQKKTKNELLLTMAGLGLVEEFKTLIAEGSDINYKNTSGQDSLLFAVQNNQPEIIKIVFENPAYFIKEDINKKLLWVAQFGLVDIFNSLLKVGADVNFVDNNGQNVLLVACENGQEDIIKAAFDAGFNIDDDNLAKQNNQLIQMVQLIEAGQPITPVKQQKDFDFNQLEYENKPKLHYPKNISGADEVELIKINSNKIGQNIDSIRRESSKKTKTQLKHN